MNFALNYFICRFAYKLLLSSTYRVFHLVVCTLILLLALIEEPSLTNLTDFSQDITHAITRVSLSWYHIAFKFYYGGLAVLVKVVNMSCETNVFQSLVIHE